MAWFFFSLISALSVTAENIMEKGMLRRQDPQLFAAVQAVLGGLVVVPFIWVVQWRLITVPVLAWLMLVSAVLCFAFVAAIKSLKHLEVSITSPMFTLTPAIAAIIGALALHEHLTSGQIWGIVALVVGGYCLQLERGRGLLYPWQRLMQSKGLHVLLLAVTLYPISAAMARVSFTQYHLAPYDFLIVTKLLGGLYYAVYLTTKRGGLRIVPRVLNQAKGKFFWVTLFSMLNSVTVIIALASTFVVQALAVKRLSAVFTTIIGGRLFHEDHLVWKTFACLFMLAGALWVALG